MFKFKVFRYISYEYFLELWHDVFGTSFSNFVAWLETRLVNIKLVAIDSDQLKLASSLHLYVIWVPGITSLYYDMDWVVYQHGDLAIFTKDRMYLNNIIRSDSDLLLLDLEQSNSGSDNEIRIGNQVRFIIKYVEHLKFNRFIDLGSGDSDLSEKLRSIFKDKYIALDLKLGHTQLYINSVVSDCVGDLVLMRNSLHHFNDLNLLSNINSKYVLVIDYFGLATTLASIYHFKYKEPFICWSLDNITFNLKKYNYFKLLDVKLNTNGPSAYLYSIHNESTVYIDSYSVDLIKNFYDMQFIDDDMSLLPFDISKLIIKSGMLRGLVDYFYDYRLPFMLKDFNNKDEYLTSVVNYSFSNIEIKPDDINMWISIIKNLGEHVCDPFCGWGSRLIAFSILNWNNPTSVFYWFDYDQFKADSTNKLINYLKLSGCQVNFLQLEDSIKITDTTFIVTSPFYLNFEKMYGSDSLYFTNVDDWANYIIGFINSKCGRLYPSIIQMNNYKGHQLGDYLFSRLPSGSKFTDVNDLGYFRFKVEFKSIIYNMLSIDNFNFGLLNRINLYSLLKDRTRFVYKYSICGYTLELVNNLVHPNCSVNLCGHFGHQNSYISGVTIYSGQLKLFNLLFELSKLNYTYVIYVGSGNGFSILTDYAIEYLTNLKGVRFLLIDKYSVVPKHLKHSSIIVINDFLTMNNWLDLLSFAKVSSKDKLLLLSDVRTQKDVTEYDYNLRRSSEFVEEVKLYNEIVNFYKNSDINIDTCLKINFSPIPYSIPSNGLFMPIGITGEFRILIQNEQILCDLEMSSEMFDMFVSSMFAIQFLNRSDVCAYCKFFDSLNI